MFLAERWGKGVKGCSTDNERRPLLGSSFTIINQCLIAKTKHCSFLWKAAPLPQDQLSLGIGKASQCFLERSPCTCFSGRELSHNVQALRRITVLFKLLKAPVLQLPLGIFILGTTEFFFPYCIPG